MPWWRGREAQADLGVARPIEDEVVGGYVHFLGVTHEDGDSVALERGYVVRRVESGVFRRDYELMEVTGVTGAHDLSDRLVGVVGEDVATDAMGVHHGSLEPGQSRFAFVSLHPEVEGDLVQPRQRLEPDQVTERVQDHQSRRGARREPSAGRRWRTSRVGGQRRLRRAEDIPRLRAESEEIPRYVDRHRHRGEVGAADVTRKIGR